MAKFAFKSDRLKKNFALSRIIKPVTGDFCLRFSSEHLTVFSFDKRRYIKVNIVPESMEGIPSDYLSNEYYVLADRTALFDSELEEIQISVNEKSLSVKTVGDGQSRQASLKKRSIRSKRPAIPEMPDLPSIKIERGKLERLLHQVSCSAMIKETKTEEDMRVNQVHFYADSHCATSNARYYGSLAYLDGMELDLSIISSDVPVIRSFCAKAVSDFIYLSQDSDRLYVIDSETESVLALSRVSTKKPALSVLDPDGFQIVLVIDQAKLSKSLKWARLAIEGTQRISFIAKGDELELHSTKEEISRLPVTFIKGDEIITDFPVKFFSSIVDHIEGDVKLMYKHEKDPTILGVSENDSKSEIRSVHYLQSMKPR